MTRGSHATASAAAAMRVAARKARRSSGYSACDEANGAAADALEARHQLDEVGVFDARGFNDQLQRRFEEKGTCRRDAAHRLVRSGADRIARGLRRERVYGREADGILDRDADGPRQQARRLLDDAPVAGDQHDRNAVGTGQCRIEERLAAGRAVDADAIDRFAKGVRERCGVAAHRVIAGEECRAAGRIDALHHAPRFWRP